MSKKIETKKLMNLPFVNATMDSFMKEVIEPVTEKGKKCFVVTANPEIVMAAKKDDSYEKILLGADYIVPDGVGILLAAKLKKDPFQERMAGVELMDRMLQLANEKGLSCFFLGAAEEVNQQCVDNISNIYPNLVMAGRHHGYMTLDDEQVVEKVREASPDFVFAALGYPKQEQWIAKYQETFSKGVFMGVGGSFDIYADRVKRAPDFWIKCRLEWLYRLFQQPSRWKRIGPLISFAFRALLRQ